MVSATEGALPRAIWGFEATPGSVKNLSVPALVRMRAHGINVVVADPRKLGQRRLDRVRLLSRDARLLVLEPQPAAQARSCAVAARPSRPCILLARTVAEATALARRRGVGLVVVHLSSPASLMGLARTASGARMLAVLQLPDRSLQSATAEWRAAIEAARRSGLIDLAVSSPTSATAPAVDSFLNLLQVELQSPPPPPTDTSPPTEPDGLVVAISSTSATLTWHKARDDVGVTEYETFVNGVSVGSGAAVSHTISGLRCATRYDFAVLARDAAGNESPRAHLAATTTTCSQIPVIPTPPAPAPSTTPATPSAAPGPETPVPPDSTPPDTTITATPLGLTNATSASFSFDSSKAGSTFACRIDGSSFGSCSSPKSYAGLGEGSHTFEVRATDAGGNTDTSPATFTWTVDTTAPNTTITAKPANVTNMTSASFSFGSTEGGSVFSCRIDGGSFSFCTSPKAYSGLGGGSHSFEVRALDGAGNSDASPAAFSWTIDTTAPETTIGTHPDAFTNATGASFTFSSEPGAGFECKLDTGSFGTCTSPKVYSGLADGDHTFSVRATDAAGNADPSPALFGWTVDATPPDATIGSHPNAVTKATGASFSFSSEPGASFECKLDTGSYGDCVSPKGFSGLADGAHSFSVRATDAIGNTGAASSFAWTVDTAAPETTIGDHPNALTKATAATFSFTSEAGASFECKRDSGGFAPCASPQSYSALADGGHSFEVRATDAAGNTDPSPASFGWTVDATAPDTTITDHPATLTKATGASFTFSSEAGAGFECKRDGGSFATCTSPLSYTGLADGGHSFEVRATDAAGNTDASPASFNWTVDTAAPDTTITDHPAALANATGASFSFSSESGAGFECKLDGGSFQSCSSPKNYGSLADGGHTFNVRATDVAGNTDQSPASFGWTVDTVAPETTIVSHPSSLSNSAAASFAFTSEPGASFECKLDTGSFGPCTSPLSYSALTDGTHAFSVRATDGAGNTDASPDSFGWTVDTVSPETTIVSHPSSLSNSAAASFGFTSEPGASFECKLDTGSYGACVSPKDFSGLADGIHTFSVRATDGAGNTDSSADSFGWTVDTIAPETSIDAHPDALTKATGASFSFSSESGASFECKLDTGSYSACISPKDYSGLADGTHSFSVRATDAAGNTDSSPASFGWTVDTTAPDTTIDSHPAVLTNVNVASFSFSSEAGASFECKLDTGVFAACASPKSYGSLADGDHSFSVRASDGAGNADPSPASFAWMVDTTPPETTITDHPAALTSATDARLSFSSEPGATFECKLDAGSFAACTSPQSYNGLADGGHSFSVRATDAAGNTDLSPASFSWAVDTVSPETTITSHPSSLSNSAAASFSFSSEPGASFECRLDSGSFAVCTSPRSYTALAEGGHSFEVRAADGAGNTDPSPAAFSWTVDTVGPVSSIACNGGSCARVFNAPVMVTLAATDLGSGVAVILYTVDGSAPIPANGLIYFGPFVVADSANVRFHAYDQAGNEEPVVEQAVSVDTVAPETTITDHPAALTSATVASFSFSSESGASFECKLDSGSFVACASPQGYTGLADGGHSFEVRATDAAGNRDPSPASFGWMVDTVAPETTIDAHPAALTNATDASFSFSSEPGASFECKLDTGVFAACASPKSYGSLADGGHSFEVRATDAAGNTDSSPASFGWRVDTVAPDTSIDAHPDALTKAITASFSFSSEAGASFECQLDTGAFVACVSPKDYSGLADGTHTFSVRATDAAGNRGSAATFGWTVDTIAPETTITSHPSSLSTSAAASFSFSSESGASFECKLDTGSYSACISPKDYSGLADGTHSFSVRATDAAGNTDSSPASFGWTVDTTAPDTTIDSHPAVLTNVNVASFSFSSEAGASFECKLDTGVFAACASPKSYGSLADGDHSFSVRASDGAGNADPSPASFAWMVDTTPPETTITDHPAALTNATDASFSFSSESGASFECKLDGGSFEACSSPRGYDSLADGGHSFAVRATDAVGNTGPAALFAWTVDTIPPETTLDAHPDALSTSSGASFAFSSEPGAGFECRLDTGAFAACTSPQSYGSLAEGDHTFNVRATDSAGNTDPTPASFSWTIDTSPPDTSIDSHPASLTNASDASFAFSSEPGTTFECKLDSGSFAACTSPQSFSALADGGHSFDVRATDTAGNTDPTPAAFGWTVDTVAPETTITDHPAALTSATVASFSFSSESGASFECKLDSGSFVACASPQGYTGLADGGHSFEVRATDAAGNRDPSPASFGWMVDTVAPETTIDAHPAALTNATDASFSFSSEPGASFECKLDTGVFAACASPKSYGSLADGGHSFEVRATDAAGNTDSSPASFGWRVDTVAPDTSIDAHPDALTKAITASFSFSSEAGASFECQLDTGAFVACVSPKDYSGLADGTHTFSVRATDAAGNRGSAATFGWTVDTIAPETTITSHPSSLSTSAAASFSFSSESGASFECKLDTGSYSACISPKDYSGLADGTHSFSVRATDAAGNTGSSPDSFDWTIDTTAPTVTISSQPDDPTNTAAASFSFASEPGARFSCALDGGSYSSCASPQSYSSLADGSHSFEVRATDAAGNTGTAATFSWTVDTTPPTVTISSQPSSPTNATTANISFSADEAATFRCELDSSAYQDCSSPQRYSGLGEGGHTFNVKATDQAGNTSTATAGWTVDATPPTVTIESTPSDPTNATLASFSFSSNENGSSFSCALDGGSFQVCTSPAGYGSLAEGSHSFAVKATDAAGNTGSAATFSWTIDLTSPTVAISSQPSSPTNVTSASFSFSSEAGASFECKLDTGSYSSCASPQSYSGLADGSHSFEVRATDAAGNTGTAATFNWTVDTIAPTTTITSGPSALTGQTSASFQFTANESGSSFECRLDGSGYGPCTSPADYSNLAEGGHTFSVRATDTAGNTGPAATFSWTIDTTSPILTITARPADPTNQTSASFSFSSNKQGAFECQLDVGVLTPCSSPVSYTGLAEGSHTFTVQATDTSGHTSAPVTYSWRIDTTPPTVAIQSGPSDPTNATSASFSFTSEPGASFSCALDSGGYQACSSPQSYSGVGEGSHTFGVQATDAAGNTGTAATFTWTVDTTAPTVSIQSGPSNPTNATSASFSFSSSEGGSSFSCALDVGGYSSCASPQSYSGLGEGSHTFQVRATDAAGNTGSAASFTWAVDTTPPTVTIQSGPADPTNATSASFSFTSEPGATFSCALDGGSYSTCTSPTSYSGLSEGSHTFKVKATDAAGNTGGATTFTWTVDTAAPTVAFDSTPSDPTNRTSATFTWHASEPVTGFECKLDSGSFSACSSGVAYSSLSEGAHAFQVEAIADLAGNAGSPTSYSWTIDLTPPATTLDSMPANPTNLTGAMFAWHASEPVTGFECSLDGGGFSPCANTISYASLADGSHTFSVKATDQAGNTGPAATYTWTVDTVAPDTSIDSHPASLTNATGAGFSFSSEAGARFECKLDAGAFASCASPQSYSGLADGGHSFEVRATDAAGNRGSAATFGWTVDTVAPETTITDQPAALTNATGASFSFSSEPGAGFECKLDSGSFAACTSPQTYTGLADGGHSFEVRASDGAGNTDPTPASFSWMVDTVAPETTIDAHPVSLTKAITATFSFSSELGASFECKLDSGSFAACASPQTYSSLVDGDHTFSVRATDAAGNTDPSPAVFGWTVDTVAPDTSIDSHPASLTNATSASFVFSSEPGATFECKLDTGVFASCASPQSLSGLADGGHSFEVRATDAAGNRGSAATFGWTVDTVAPETTITDQPAALTNATGASFSFSSEPGASFECKLDGGGFGPCSSPQSYTALAEAGHSFAVRATDRAGNTDSSPAAFSWTVDTTAPDTSIDSHPASLTNATGASFSFSSEAGAGFECKLDTGAFAACTSPQTYGGLADGDHSFSVRATDGAGNTDPTPASFAWTVDTAAPETTIGSHPAALTNATDASFSFSSEPGASFECKLDGGSFQACSSPKGYDSLADGGHSFQVRATDAAGNTDPTPAAFSWTVDTTPPDASIDTHPASPTNATGASFSFSSEPGATFECKLDLGSFAVCTSPQAHSGLADGSHVFEVRATDAAGNTGAAAPFAWTIDTVAPVSSISCNGGSCTRLFNGVVTVTLSSTDLGSGVDRILYTLDGSDPSPIHGTFYLGGFLVTSTTDVRFRAYDKAGNEEAIGSQTVTIDMVAPETSLDSHPNSLANATEASFSFSSESGATFECRLDGGSFESCSSPKSYSGLAEGDHSFEVRATDAAGNTDPTPASFGWTIDTTAPDTAIDTHPAPLTNATGASFTFSSESGVSFECKLDTGSFAACSSPQSYTGLADGGHSFQVRATDAAGNTDPTPASFSWTVDTVAPDTTIDTHPASLTNATGASFSFSSESGASFECKLDGGSFGPCTSPQSYSSFADGDHSFQVRAADAAGNTGSAASFGWTVDTAAPGTSIDSHPPTLTNSPAAVFAFSGEAGASFECKLDAGSFGSCSSPTSYDALADGSHTFQARATDAAGNTGSPASFSWTVDMTPPDTAIETHPASLTNETGASFSFSSESGASFECKLDGGSFESCSSQKDYSGLGEGSHSFEVRATDPAGNQDATPASFTWTVDTTAPNTTITAKPADPTSATGASFAFDSNDATASFACRLDDGSFAACTSPKSYSGLGEGSHTFEVRATDTAGNTDASPASFAWTIDTTAPDTTITASPADPTSATAASFSFGSSETASSFACRLDGGSFAACTSPKSYTGLPEGSHTFEVRATDAAGNQDATAAAFTWTVDLTPPVTVDDAPAGWSSGAVTVSLSASDGGSGVAVTEYSVDGGVSFQQGTSVVFSAEGVHELRYRSVDRVGNVEATKTVLVRIDLTAPQVAAANVNGSTLVLTLDEPLGAAVVGASAFSVRVNGGAAVAPVSVGSVVYGVTEVMLGLSAPVANGDVVTLSYDPSGLAAGARVADWAGNALAGFTDRVVTNVTPAPAPASFINERLIVGLNEPTAMAFAPDGRMLIIGRRGTVWVVQPGATQVDPTPMLQLTTVTAADERGLLGIALDPAFETNGYMYLFYTNSVSLQNRVSRFTVAGNSADPGSEQVLWDNPVQSAMWHQGGTIAFGPDGMLYISVGDNLDRPSVQSLSSYNGKILRIAPDGSIPSDNPFVDGAGPNKDEIWALGLRNPFRFSFDLPTGRMFIGDVGEGTTEEIDLGVKGGNYGWPICEGTCATAGMINPIHSYQHNIQDASVVGGFVYRGSQFPAEYQGSYFYADYSRNYIRRLTLDSAGTTVTADLPFEPADGSRDGPYGDPVDLTEGPDGALYYVDLGPFATPNTGAIRRIRNVNANQPPTAVSAASPESGPAPLNVSFSSAGSIDPEGSPLSYRWDFGDGTSSTEANPSHNYTHNGRYTVRLTVSDGVNDRLATPLAITVGAPPVVTVLTPSNGTSFHAGDVISYSGQATDPEDGVLTGAALSWTIVFHHMTHIHPGPLGATGTSGSFTVPDSGHLLDGDTSYEIVLTATDSDGLQTSSSVTIHPLTVDLRFASAPAGLRVNVDGTDYTTPFKLNTTVGFHHNVVAVSPQILNGVRYAFDSWSDGATRARTITAPETTGFYTATYTVDHTAVLGLVGAYSFDEGSGGTLFDYSGHGNDGTITGAGWSTNGKTGGALAFDGVGDDLVTIPDSNSLDLTTAFTLEAWIKPATIGFGSKTILLKAQPNQLLYALYATEEQSGRSSTHAWLAGADERVIATDPLVPGVWTHIAATYDGTTLRLYVNGIEVNNQPLTGSIPTSTDPLTLGGNPIWGEAYDGLLDDIRIYNRPLTPAEIQADMTTPVGDLGTSGSDVTPPSVPVLVFSGLSNAVVSGSSVFYRSGVAGGFTVTPSSVDAESGVAGYSLPGLGAGWSLSGNDYAFAAGAVDPVEPFGVTAVNGAGLSSAASSFSVSADGVAPVTVDDAPAGWSSGAVTVSLSASDGGSGVAVTEYSVDGGVSFQQGTSVVFSAEGVHELRYRSVDRVGNVEATKTVLVRIDLTAPQVAAANVNGSTLVLTLDEPLGAAVVGASAFSVRVNGGAAVAPVSVGSVVYGVSEVMLGLGVPVVSGDVVTLSYDPSGLAAGARVADWAGNALAGFTDRVVTNVTPAPAPASFINERLIVGLNEPTAMAFAPDGRMLIIGRRGTVWVVQPGATQVDPTPMLQLTTVTAADERGLLGIALDPAFETNGYMYLFYTNSVSLQNRVSRFTVAGNSADPGSEQVLWDNPVQSAMWHQGGTIAFGPDGMLYISVGDNLDRPSVQSLSSYNGKILRIAPDGSIPSDNPFVDGAGPNKDEIWALGLRNPFRFSFDLPTGRMFIGDVGEGTTEEIDLGVKGGNYGWPICEGTCATAGMINPIHSYQHNIQDAAVVGGFVYRGSQFPAEYQGSYFYADYSRNWIRRLTLDSAGTTVTADLPFEPADGSRDGPYGDPVDLTEGPDGALYYVDLGPFATPNTGAIRRIRNVNANQPPTAVAAASPESGLAPLDVAFSSAGSIDPEGSPLSYRWDFGDGTSSTQANPSHRYTRNGRYTVRLTVSDGVNERLASPLAITVGIAPTVTVLTPSNGASFHAGDVISYSGQATDSAGGPLTGASLSWTIVFHHMTHIHPGPLGATGSSGSFTVPDTGHILDGDTSYEIVLTATDSDGLQTSSSVTIHPQPVDLRFASAPAGLRVSVDGTDYTTPFKLNTTVGFHHNVVAVSPQILNGVRYAFDSWSDGATRARTITAPETTGFYTATYTVDHTAVLGLVGAYSFDEGSGGTLFDYSGHGNDGTITGAGWSTNGKTGGALAFDGVGDDLVTIPDSNSLDLTTAFTLEAWIKPATIGFGSKTILLKAQPNQLLYALYATEEQSGRSSTHAWLAGADERVIATDPLVPGVWTHIAATYDGTTLRLYVNGIEVNNQPLTGSIPTSTDPLTLGGNPIWGEAYDGLLDDIRIYNRPLTPAEIQADMTTPVGG